MNSRQVKVVPFSPSLKEGQAVEGVAMQLQELIDRHGVQGWQFYNVTQVVVQVRPGCLAGVFGAKSSAMHVNQAIFYSEGQE